MKALLSTAAVAAFAATAVASSGGAQAQCMWTGLGYSCAAPPAAYYPAPYWETPYAAWNAWDYRDYRYKPDWLPSYPGPKVGPR